MNPKDVIHPSWNPILGKLYQEPLITLNEDVLAKIASNPASKDIFNVFSMPIKNIKVIILGEEPYRNPRYSTGYAFAAPTELPMPELLKTIQTEVLDSDPSNMNGSGEIDLMQWVDQGVFLLNTSLTAEIGKYGSHIDYWQPFIKGVINYIAIHQPCIWLFWGTRAQSFLNGIPDKSVINAGKYSRQDIDNIPISPSNNYILKCPHPITEVYDSGRFYGCDHFYKTNRILSLKRQEKIKW